MTNTTRNNFVVRPARRGFTLTEILISVALALLVLYGVNKVFQATAITIGTGSALSDANRSMRGIASNLSSDFNPQIDATGTITTIVGSEVPGTGIIPSVTPDVDLRRQPAIAIRAERRMVYLNKADQDANGTNTVDMWDPMNDGSFIAVPPTVINRRNHRLDTLSFFTGGKVGATGTGSFRRQTGQIMNGRESMVTDLAAPAQYAWVWYGHARQPRNPDLLDFTDGSDATPTGNYWHPGQGSPVDTDPAYNPNNYYAASWTLARRATLIIPRDNAFTAPNPGYVNDANGQPMWFYRSTGTADISPIGYGSAARYTTDGGINDLPVTPSANLQDRIQNSIYDIAAIEAGIGISTGTPDGIFARFNTPAATYWHLLAQDGFTDGNAYRFASNLLVGAPLINQPGQMPPSIKGALTSTVLASGCTQFIVEFAGDFDNNGQLDMRVVNGVSEIQWYGLPRDVNRDGTIDVDTIDAIHGTIPAIEHRLPDPADAAPVYTVVWGPAELANNATRPHLIRITVQIVDANGRLQDGLTREFIYRVR